MNRSGLDPEDLPALLKFFETKRKVIIRSMFSHLAGSDEARHDEYTLFQINRFIEMTKEVQARFDYPIIRHILNSAGIERFGQYAFDMSVWVSDYMGSVPWGHRYGLSVALRPILRQFVR